MVIHPLLKLCNLYCFNHSDESTKVTLFLLPLSRFQQEIDFMQTDARHTPDYIFESSWEVCNKVGGIYTVLSSHANTLQREHKDKVIFIGPDIWGEDESPWFKEDLSLHKEWREYADLNGDLSVRIGRWTVPGEPITILVNF